MPQSADIVIIGGGIIGASIAYHLVQEERHRRVLVIEQDTTYARAATQLSMGGIRQQYSAAWGTHNIHAGFAVNVLHA